ncbi:MAG: OFA family MFS transporter [Prosthecobacter sp.]|uniref:L-lactate MFS transporter n=1 Tax=Prosthecobacter sp. TaxID=1965333 RepID=UPI0025D12C77|nr:OFA family MFS transporter [Prosthecobacter sp.]MCF7786135.1 OFA family MFS transporter [Prosthecobacter sp.]
MSFLSREATVASPGFSRWLVPPSAIAVHMCIGQVYGFSVFKKPLARALGITAPIPGDWSVAEIGVAYSIALALLGLSAAFFGKWVERSGPRKTMLASLLFFCGGLVLTALAVHWHQLWLLYAGYGLIGGIGLGLGYIAPVSTLMKWFPDRPGMATGMAIMGFGGGALIGGPLAEELMKYFATDVSVGAIEALLVMAGLYAVSMLFGAMIVRVPPEGWKPAGWVPTEHVSKLVTTANVSVDTAWKTPQFWLLWVVLCMNVSAGIGILGQASPMIQDMFKVTPEAAAGYVGLLSLCNLGGRFFWSSMSDFIGRKGIYCIYFILGAALYASVPWIQGQGSVTLFVVATGLILTMYGGGFATIPAYLRDLFGSYQVGAIHGRLITAWSVAAILGPQLMDRLSMANKKVMPPEQAYNSIFHLMVGLLVVGLISNLLVRPVDPKHHLAENAQA